MWKIGKRGPLPKDNRLRLVDNDNKNRKTAPKPKPAQPVKPKMPPGLDKRAQAEWRRVADRLYKAGLLTELDKLTLSIYCQIVSRYERYNEALELEGEYYEAASGQKKLHPLYQARENATKELRMLIKEFGLSPNARMRMELPPSDVNELSEFESLLDE